MDQHFGAQQLWEGLDRLEMTKIEEQPVESRSVGVYP
jgi:hypothetical protein